MTTRDNCAVVFIVYALIDTNKQEGLDILNDTLDVLGITFQDFMEYIEQIPKTESSRFAVYSEIKKLSTQDKGLVRKLMVDGVSAIYPQSDMNAYSLPLSRGSSP